MTDLIERRAAIDAMAELQGRASTKAELNGISKAWKRIKQLPSAQPEDKCSECDAWNKYKNYPQEQRWIPVDLRNNSPEENKVVLLGVRFRDDFKYFVTSRQDYNYWTGLGREIKGKLRWQPLPEPYQEEGE